MFCSCPRPCWSRALPRTRASNPAKEIRIKIRVVQPFLLQTPNFLHGFKHLLKLAVRIFNILKFLRACEDSALYFCNLGRELFDCHIRAYCVKRFAPLQIGPPSRSVGSSGLERDCHGIRRSFLGNEILITIPTNRHVRIKIYFELSRSPTHWVVSS